MILRRVIAHFKKQEWTAIALDFLIVVVGVFVGLQVNNWNERQGDRRRESAYLQRLHDDIASLRADTARDERSVKARNALMQAAMASFESRDAAGLAALGSEHCSAIVRSHIYASGIVTPPTIGEILQSGEVGIIQDPELRAAIVRFDQAVEDMSQLRADLQIDRRSLGRFYSNYIKVGLRGWEDSECRFAELINDQGFLNDFADNLRRDDAFTSSVIGRLNTMQRDLHAMLDETLGLAHEPETAKGASDEG
jgi:hypothetical protein